MIEGLKTLPITQNGTSNRNLNSIFSPTLHDKKYKDDIKKYFCSHGPTNGAFHKIKKLISFFLNRILDPPTNSNTTKIHCVLARIFYILSKSYYFYNNLFIAFANLYFFSLTISKDKAIYLLHNTGIAFFF